MKTLTKTGWLRKKAFQVVLPALMLSAFSASAQISEDFGTLTSTNYSTYTHYSSTGYPFSGSGEIRTTSPSNGYSTPCGAASGGSNAFINPGKDFIINGINTTGCVGAPISMSFGIFKSTTTENGSHMVVEYQLNASSTWTVLGTITLPTGAGTSKWYSYTLGSIPVDCNMKLRFSNTASSAPFFRIDDICINCAAPVVTSCSASITPNGFIELCAGGSVTLTANSGTSYLWSDGETTSSINVSVSGTYWVTVINGCCSATSDRVRVLVHHYDPSPVVVASADLSTVCLSNSTDTLRVVTLAPDLIISQVQEGAGFDKAIEIYNGTGHSVDLANYHLREYMNGNCAFQYSLDFAPTTPLANNSTYVIANDAHSQIGGTLCYQKLWNELLFNGNDAIELHNDLTDSPADIFGSICHNPGSAWTAAPNFSTENSTLYRKPCIFEGIVVNPDLDGASGFSTLGTEWIIDTLASDTGFCSHAFGATSYTWSAGTTPSTGGKVVVTPTVTTTYTVTGVYCDGCPYTSTVTVTVDPGCRLAAPQSNTPATEINAEAYPNPFSGTVTLNVNTQENGLVKVEVLNMLGQTVAVLNNTTLPAGTHTFTWNGSADNGANLADGVYSCKVTTGNAVKSVMLVKSSK